MPVETNGTKILARITAIEVAGVDFSFGEQKILTNFSRRFERGKIYCVVGKNGAGKSTLMNLICSMIRPSGGEIFFDGVPLAEVDMIHARKNLIAAVEQKDFLKNDNLSGGERRKASIANALKKSADVLIMDEPDNNLDTKNPAPAQGTRFLLSADLQAEPCQKIVGSHILTRKLVTRLLPLSTSVLDTKNPAPAQGTRFFIVCLFASGATSENRRQSYFDAQAGDAFVAVNEAMILNQSRKTIVPPVLRQRDKETRRRNSETER